MIDWWVDRLIDWCFMLLSTWFYSISLCPPGWRVGLMTWWLWPRYLIEANFLSDVLLPLTYAGAEVVSGFGKESCVSTGMKTHVHHQTLWYDLSCLKVAVQILGRKIYKNTKKSSLYSQSLLFFIHKTPVVKSNSTTREIRDLLRPRSTPMGNTVYFYTSSSLIFILKIHRRSFKHSVQWRHYENNYMLWNLSIISYQIFPQCFFFYFWREI